MSQPATDLMNDLCFVMMPFDRAFEHVYRDGIAPAIAEAGLKSVRADEIASLGVISEEIREYVKAARILVADLTNRNPNVFYELGMAHTYDKPVIMITQRDEDVPFDIRHIRYFNYLPNPEGLSALRNQLKELIASLCFPSKALLERMLVADNDDDVHLLHGTILSKVGITNLTPNGIKAKQNDLVGLEVLLKGLRQVFPDRLHIKDANAIRGDDDLFTRERNIVLTGGPKANPWYAAYAQRIQEGRTPRWEFEPRDEEDRTGPWQVTRDGDPWPGLTYDNRDYGLILRGPSSNDSKHMILVLVGLGSPGQIAANIAVTDGYLISEIDSKLEGKLENKKLHIWIVVSCAVEDFVLIPNTVVVEDAGVSQGQCAKQG